MLGFFRRSPLETVRAFVALAGDELVNETPLESTYHYEWWSTKEGVVTYEYDQPEFGPAVRSPERLDVIGYQSKRPWLGTDPGEVEASVGQLFAKMGAPASLRINFTLDHEVRLSMEWIQVHAGGEFLATTGRYDWEGSAGGLTEVRPVYALTGEGPGLSWDSAYTGARSYVLCLLQKEGIADEQHPVPPMQTAPARLPWASINGTFSYSIPFLFPSDCLEKGERIVFVDAVTGAVVAHRDASTCEQ